jgi:dimethylargininase
MLIAITRDVSPTIEQCELTHVERKTIDVQAARAQHRHYEACLADLGCELHRLPAAPDLPDSVFVEDTAVVLDELAVITRPGALSRRPEISAVAHVLQGYRRLSYIEHPGTLDGGDVLRIDSALFVGRSSRSNQAGIEQLRHIVTPHGYSVVEVPVHGCLHLKSAATQVAPYTLLVNRAWLDTGSFGQMQLIEVDSSEPFAANALLIQDTVIYPAEFPATRARLEEQGIQLCIVDVSELSKAEGGVTCCSLVFTQT